MTIKRLDLSFGDTVSLGINNNNIFSGYYTFNLSTLALSSSDEATLSLYKDTISSNHVLVDPNDYTLSIVDDIPTLDIFTENKEGDVRFYLEQQWNESSYAYNKDELKNGYYIHSNNDVLNRFYDIDIVSVTLHPDSGPDIEVTEFTFDKDTHKLFLDTDLEGGINFSYTLLNTVPITLNSDDTITQPYIKYFSSSSNYYGYMFDVTIEEDTPFETSFSYLSELDDLNLSIIVNVASSNTRYTLTEEDFELDPDTNNYVIKAGVLSPGPYEYLYFYGFPTSTEVVGQILDYPESELVSIYGLNNEEYPLITLDSYTFDDETFTITITSTNTVGGGRCGFRCVCETTNAISFNQGGSVYELWNEFDYSSGGGGEGSS